MFPAEYWLYSFLLSAKPLKTEAENQQMLFILNKILKCKSH